MSESKAPARVVDAVNNIRFALKYLEAINSLVHTGDDVDPEVKLELAGSAADSCRTYCKEAIGAIQQCFPEDPSLNKAPLEGGQS